MEKEAKKSLLERIAHLLAALTIFLKGVTILGVPGKIPAAFLFMFIGLLFLALAVFHGPIKGKLMHLKSAIFALEALVIGLIGYLYWKEGKIYLPYVYFAACLAYVMLAVFYAVKKPGKAV